MHTLTFYPLGDAGVIPIKHGPRHRVLLPPRLTPGGDEWVLLDRKGEHWLC